MRSFALLLLVCTSFVLGDVYMHHPRGSNNRLNEQNAERDNDERLFDSQNNNRGGYNVGDKSNNAANAFATPATTFDYTDTTTAIQYQFVYYEGSQLQIEWTNQHGCGGNELNDQEKQNCNILLQYACDSDNTDPNSPSTIDPAMVVALRDGTTTTTVNTDGTDNTRGYHESAAFYRECTTRSRNQGLFTADQNLNGNTADFTRQNPNGNNNNNDRNGLECPEERDYYPYWQPTMWRDIVYLTDRLDLCPFITSNSQNNNQVFKCFDTQYRANVLSRTTSSSCINAGGSWNGYSWGIGAPLCVQSDWSRSNHLGNGRHGAQMNHYNWTLPMISDLRYTAVYDGMYRKCVLRLRYNISTDDYDPWNTNSTYNQNKAVIADNPTVNIGADLQGLKLALNTDQTGRTFQDRSHIFYIRSRPSYLQGAAIWNLNVRGKRGNIVQTYPSMEYDFVPNRLHVNTTEYIHLQWTGSNTHDNNPDSENAGDGQGGDAGEGTGGTDRHNFVQINNDLSTNFPIPLDQAPLVPNMWYNGATKCWDLAGTQVNNVVAGVNVDCALWLATSGFYRTASAVTGATGGGDTLSTTLDNAPASLIGGMVLQVQAPGTYHYIGSRNNNFSNRSQKATIIVSA